MVKGKIRSTLMLSGYGDKGKVKKSSHNHSEERLRWGYESVSKSNSIRDACNDGGGKMGNGGKKNNVTFILGHYRGFQMETGQNLLETLM